MEVREPSTAFRLSNPSEVSSYLKLRGYGLFNSLQPQISHVYYSKPVSSDINFEQGGETWKKTQIEDNWTVRVKENRDVTSDYSQYEIYSEIDQPNEE